MSTSALSKWQYFSAALFWITVALWTYSYYDSYDFQLSDQSRVHASSGHVFLILGNAEMYMPWDTEDFDALRGRHFQRFHVGFERFGTRDEYGHYRTFIGLPYAWIAAPLFLFMVWMLALMARCERRNRLNVLLGRCPGCGYDIRATPNRCPECGREIGPRAK